MHGLILAGGEGSRLTTEGVGVPKPLVELRGQPLVLGLLETLAGLGCETLTCMVRADFAAVFSLLQRYEFGRPFSLQACNTPSSLHTLVAGLAAVPEGPVFCTMVDTVMAGRDWQRVYEGTGRALTEGATAVLAVTPFVDDESPVYVSRDQNGFVRVLGDHLLEPPCVTGGVYGLSAVARQAAKDALGRGVVRMRGFLKALVADGARIATVTVPRIIDIDHEADLRLANAWLGSPEARA